MKGPPRWVSRAVSALLPEDERDYVIGDLEEGFALREARAGRLRATAWYVLQAARSLWPMLTYPGRWRWTTMAGTRQDLRAALRIFRREPGFAAAAVLTLGIGVGGASAVYSVVRGVLLSPMPFEDPDRVVMLWGRTPDYPRAPLTVGDYQELAREVEAFESITASWGNNALILGEGEAEQVDLGWVTPGFFDVVGVQPLIGRAPEPGDQDGIVISHALWVRRYGSDPSVIGRTVQLTGGTFEIVGVLPSGRDPDLTTTSRGLTDYDVWRLQPPEWLEGDDRSVGWLRATARLADGVALEQAQAEVDALIERINARITSRDGGTDLRVSLTPVRADLVGDVSRTLWTLLAAVCGVLLIAATNVANLLLARGETRSGEMALRTALGGSRTRLARLLLVESGALALAGGLLGVALAWQGVHALLALAPPTLPRLDQVRLDAAALGFALAATALAAAIFALVPAARASRTDPYRTLGDRRATHGPRRRRLSEGLVVAEVALSLALVTATGLLLKSVAGLARTDLGFETEGIVTFALEVPSFGATAEEAAANMTAYVDGLEAVPGVRSAAFTNRVPLGGGLFTGTYRSEEMVAADLPALEASVRYVTPAYFATMGARLLAGRTFEPGDPLGMVVIDERMADRLWPDGRAVGRRLETSTVGAEPSWSEVVGVVAPMKHAGVAEPAFETLFMPMLAYAHMQNFRYAAVRVAGSPADHVDALRRAVREVDANAVLARVRPMADLYDEDVAATRFAAFLLSVFGGVATLLAAVGLHGVIGFTVRQRSREIGIRVALGARRLTVLRDALASGAALVVAGIALGTALSLGLGRLLDALLFEVRPNDAATLVGAASLMTVVGLLGAYLPARLVLRVDPAVTLREE